MYTEIILLSSMKQYNSLFLPRNNTTTNGNWDGFVSDCGNFTETESYKIYILANQTDMPA